MEKEIAKQEVAKLVKEFSEYSKEQIDSKKEFQIQSEFIDPLFNALGWDMRKEAEREERVLKGRADYILRIGNQKKLVIEAKATDVKLDEKEGKQSVSYAYHKNIKFAVVTNFRQIRVYHALSNIKNIDKNLVKDEKGYLIFNCEDFVKEFDRLWFLSRESFEKEEINKLLENVDKRLIKPIDESILTDLLQYREWLSKDLKNKRNNLEDPKIDEIVQILIDRLIFMRSVEDRGLEAEDFLLKIIRDVEKGFTDMNLWVVLKEQFKRFDNSYNSKLFSEGLLEKEGFFDNNVLSKVIRGLYYGTQDLQERYRFDDLPVDLLGSIYEQYLGVVLRGTEKRVKLDLLSGKRKKMGIYYTPKYIVDYILDNTVCEYAKNKTLDEILEIKIVDPACGSGSFLLDAFEELKKIIEQRLKKGERSNRWDTFKEFKERLNLGQKATILLNCIYGVDLDEKAVELTQLNLLLKILEEETRETRKRILPNMKNNIKNGNSLIDDSSLDKAFNWNAQFPEVFRNGGFDIVIGNPPYIRNTELSNEDKTIFNKTFFSSYKQYDIYVLFFELGLKLLKNKGVLGFITSNKFIASDYGMKIRDLILRNSKIKKIIDVSNVSVFKDASTYPSITILQKEEDEELRVNNRVLFKDVNNEKELLDEGYLEVLQNDFIRENNEFLQSNIGESSQLIKKIEKNTKGIGELFICQRGSPKNKIKITKKGTGDSFPCIISKDVGRYNHKVSNNVSVISNLQKTIIDKEKILIPRTVLNLKASYDEGKKFIMDRIYYLIPKSNINLDLLYVLGLLNSKLIDFYYKNKFKSTHVGGGYLDLRGVQIKKLPIKLPDEKQAKRIKELVERIMQFYKEGKPEQQIKNIDYEIDEEIYRLYGITEEEQKIIEERLK